MGNSKIPILVCLVLTLIANALYAYLQSIAAVTDKARYGMLLSRIIMGLGACKEKKDTFEK